MPIGVSPFFLLPGPRIAGNRLIIPLFQHLAIGFAEYLARIPLFPRPTPRIAGNRLIIPLFQHLAIDFAEYRPIIPLFLLTGISISLPDSRNAHPRTPSHTRGRISKRQNGAGKSRHRAS